MSEYGMPYMGSKDKIAPSIAICLPSADHFYDLFGGGGSITHCMCITKAHKYKHFHYNEIKADVAELLRRAINGEFNYDKFNPAWVSSEEFKRLKDTDAYIRCIWSFGNNQKNYLFGDCESYKKSMHMAIVFDEFDSLVQEVLGFNKWPAIAKTIKQRRFYLRQKIEWYNTNKKIPKVLYQYLSEKQLKEMGIKGNVKQLQQLQQLQQLEQLQRLEQLEQLERLTITGLDYRQVEILPNSVVYCDIPYKDTSDYGDFLHKEFFDWAATRNFPVYISEYNMSDTRFKLVYEIDKRVLLTSTGDSNKIKSEKLYWNGK